MQKTGKANNASKSVANKRSIMCKKAFTHIWSRQRQLSFVCLDVIHVENRSLHRFNIVTDNYIFRTNGDMKCQSTRN